MIQKIKEIAKGAPAVLTGDFNGNRSSDWYQRIAGSDILRDSHKDVAFPYENNASFNNFGKDISGNEVIDHIFLSRQWRALKWGILTDTYHGKYPSDHFPVEAIIQLQ